MATPNTRDELIDYCLRALGHPVLEVNVADEQMEDRIDEDIADGSVIGRVPVDPS